MEFRAELIESSLSLILDWFLGKEDGEGEMFFQDGAHYQGSWVAGQRGGIGIIVYANGDKFVGEWADGKRQGQQGAYMFKDYGYVMYRYYDYNSLLTLVHTSKFLGRYVDDKANGPGEYHSFSGKIVTGDFLEITATLPDGVYSGFTMAGKQWGRGMMKYNNGDVYIGEWKVGQRSGYGILTKGISLLRAYIVIEVPNICDTS